MSLTNWVQERLDMSKSACMANCNPKDKDKLHNRFMVVCNTLRTVMMLCSCALFVEVWQWPWHVLHQQRA
jgi:hypothetical protein